MKERAHLPSEFMVIDGESGTEGLYMIYTDDQEPQSGDLVVLENIHGEKVFCTLGGEPGPLRKEGLMQVLRVSRLTHQ